MKNPPSIFKSFDLPIEYRLPLIKQLVNKQNSCLSPSLSLNSIQQPDYRAVFLLPLSSIDWFWSIDRHLRFYCSRKQTKSCQLTAGSQLTSSTEHLNNVKWLHLSLYLSLSAVRSLVRPNNHYWTDNNDHSSAATIWANHFNMQSWNILIGGQAKASKLYPYRRSFLIKQKKSLSSRLLEAAASLKKAPNCRSLIQHSYLLATSNVKL